jgi:hypothetical protein
MTVMEDNYIYEIPAVNRATGVRNVELRHNFNGAEDFDPMSARFSKPPPTYYK